ncbi:MAG: hypothetical protein ACM3S1_13865 [Hyphomicrobiales bacterium]
MSRTWILWVMLGVVAALAVGIGVAFAVRGGGDTPVSSPPNGGGPQQAAELPLHEARLELASQVNVPATAITLTGIRAAGFDGCLGVYRPNMACTEQFIAGYIATFEANGREYRFHFGGNSFIATDFQPRGTRIDDGMPVPPEVAPDFVSILAGYARGDVALTEGVAPGDVTVVSLVPSVCPPLVSCPFPGDSGAVELSLGSKTFQYLVVPGSGTPVERQSQPDPFPWAADVQALQLRLREDLSGRVGADLPHISVSAFRLVTWPDGCIGVTEPGKVCSQALVDGWEATLTAGGQSYRYHGSGDPHADSHFVAADFVPGAIVVPGLGRRAN